MEERNEYSYHLEKDHQKFILSTSLIGNKIKIAYNCNSQIFDGIFSLNDLNNLSNYFRAGYYSIEQIQMYINKLLEKQSVGISGNENALSIILYLPNKDQIVIPLAKKLFKDNIYNYNNYNLQQNIQSTPQYISPSTNKYFKKNSHPIPTGQTAFKNVNNMQYNYQYDENKKVQSGNDNIRAENEKIKNDMKKILGESAKLKEQNQVYKTDHDSLTKENAILKEGNDNYKKRITELENEIKGIQEENNSLKNQIVLLNKDVDAFESQNNEIRKMYEDLENENNNYKNQMEELSKDNELLRVQIEELNNNFTLINNELESIKNENNEIKITLEQQNNNNDNEELINRLEEENNIYKQKAQENEMLKQKIEELQYQLQMAQERPTEFEQGQGKEVEGDIIHDIKELEMITKKINKDENKKIIINLLYKASIDSDKASVFHEKCDKANNTIVLVETKNGKRFGGYTTCSWSGNCVDKSDPEAFIFSFDKMKTYDNIPGDDAIGCYPKFGPIFLGCQIKIFDNAFIKGGTTFEKELNFNTEEDYELTGGDRIFEVKDIEVYEVIFE